jgi:hypothetical protein
VNSVNAELVHNLFASLILCFLCFEKAEMKKGGPPAEAG